MKLDVRALLKPWLIPLSIWVVIIVLMGDGWWWLRHEQADTLAQFVPADAPLYLHWSFPRQRRGMPTASTPLAMMVLDTLEQTLFADLPGILTDAYGQPAFDRELAVVLTADQQWLALVRLTKHQAEEQRSKNVARFVAPQVLIAGHDALIDQLLISSHSRPSGATAVRQTLTLPPPLMTGQLLPAQLTTLNLAEPMRTLLNSWTTPLRISIDWVGNSWLATDRAAMAFAPLVTAAVPAQTVITLATANPAELLTTLPQGQFTFWAALTRTVPWSTDQVRFWQRPTQVIITRPTSTTLGWVVLFPRLANDTLDTLQTMVLPLLAARSPVMRRHWLPDGSTSQELVSAVTAITSATTGNYRTLVAPNDERWYLGMTDNLLFFGDDHAATAQLVANDSLLFISCPNQALPGIAVALSELVPNAATSQLFFTGSGSTSLLSGCITSPQ